MAICQHDQKKIIDRINRIEGQVRGLRKMVESDAECFDFLKQVSAVAGALRSLSVVVLEDHLRGCVSEAIRTEDNYEELIGQVIEVFNKFGK